MPRLAYVWAIICLTCAGEVDWKDTTANRSCKAAENATGSTSQSLRRDLEDFFCALPWPRQSPLTQSSRCGAKALTVLEVGILGGDTTVALASLFHRVIAVDVNPHWIKHARDRCRSAGVDQNVVFVLMDVYSDNWNTLKENHVDVVFIDAAHNYASVLSDAINSLQIPTIQWLVFHDYGDNNEEVTRTNGMQVKLAVDALIAEAVIECGHGSPPPPARHSSTGGTIGRLWSELANCDIPEGIVCKVVSQWDWSAPHAALAWKRNREHAPLIGTTPWYLYGMGKAISTTAMSARCSTTEDQVQCHGAVQGIGRAYATSEHSSLAQVWKFASGASLTLQLTKEATSFQGQYESAPGADSVDILGVSARAVEGIIWKETSFLETQFGSPCCPVPREVQVSGEMSCFHMTQQLLMDTLQVSAMPQCADKMQSECSGVHYCAKSEANSFRAAFGVSAWVHAWARRSPAVNRSIADFIAMLGDSANLPTVWHLTACMPCMSLPGTADRRAFLLGTMYELTRRLSPAVGAELQKLLRAHVTQGLLPPVDPYAKIWRLRPVPPRTLFRG